MPHCWGRPAATARLHHTSRLHMTAHPPYVHKCEQLKLRLQAGVQHYTNLSDTLLANCIEPHLTLCEWLQHGRPGVARAYPVCLLCWGATTGQQLQRWPPVVGLQQPAASCMHMVDFDAMLCCAVPAVPQTTGTCRKLWRTDMGAG